MTTTAAQLLAQEVQPLAIALLLIAQEPGPTAEQAKAELEQQADRRHALDLRKHKAAISFSGSMPKRHHPTQMEIDRFVAERSQARRLSEWEKKARTVFYRTWLRLSIDSKTNAQNILAAIYSNVTKGTQFNYPATIQTLYGLTVEGEIPQAVHKREAREVPPSGVKMRLPLHTDPQNVRAPKKPKGAGSNPTRWTGRGKLAVLKYLLANPSAQTRKSIVAGAGKTGGGKPAAIQACLVDLKAAGWLSEGEMGTCLSEKGIKKARKISGET